MYALGYASHREHYQDYPVLPYTALLRGDGAGDLTTHAHSSNRGRGAVRLYGVHQQQPRYNGKARDAYSKSALPLARQHYPGGTTQVICDSTGADRTDRYSALCLLTIQVQLA